MGLNKLAENHQFLPPSIEPISWGEGVETRKAESSKLKRVNATNNDNDQNDPNRYMDINKDLIRKVKGFLDEDEGRCLYETALKANS